MSEPHSDPQQTLVFIASATWGHMHQGDEDNDGWRHRADCRVCAALKELESTLEQLETARDDASAFATEAELRAQDNDRLKEQHEATKREIEVLRQTCAISFSDKDVGIATLIRRAEAAEERERRLIEQLESLRGTLEQIARMTDTEPFTHPRGVANAPSLARTALDSFPASEPEAS